MQEREQLITAIICATPEKKLVSRVRLQKIAYLLDKTGFSTGVTFSYHHYGPYSHDLDVAISDAKAQDYIVEEFGYRKSDSASYSIFKVGSKNDRSTKGAFSSSAFVDKVKRFSTTNVTVLELAATAHWIKECEKNEDWKREIVRRKGVKATNERLEKALNLLKDIGLPPGKETYLAS